MHIECAHIGEAKVAAQFLADIGKKRANLIDFFVQRIQFCLRRHKVLRQRFRGRGRHNAGGNRLFGALNIAFAAVIISVALYMLVRNLYLS